VNKATGPRLLFRVDPLPLESPRGYLSRVAQEHGYHGPLAIAQIADLQRTSLERDEDAVQIAYVLRLEPEQWQAMCYRPIRVDGRYRQRSFCGERITADDLNYERTRVCPDCLKDRPIWWAVCELSANLHKGWAGRIFSGGYSPDSLLSGRGLVPSSLQRR
jgi:hypothetical protein